MPWDTPSPPRMCAVEAPLAGTGPSFCATYDYEGDDEACHVTSLPAGGRQYMLAPPAGQKPFLSASRHADEACHVSPLPAAGRQYVLGLEDSSSTSVWCS